MRVGSIAVAVITRNRAESLRRTLYGIKADDYPIDEIFVVDNDSTDNTREVALSFPVTYLFCSRDKGFSGARQMVIDSASSEFLAWCDDDCVPIKGWLSAFMYRFGEHDNIALIGGKVNNHGFASHMKFKGTEIMLPNGKLVPVENPFAAQFFGNLNMAVRVGAVKNVGGYDPFFKGCYEEVDLIMVLRSRGYLVVYEPLAVVDHYHNQVSFKRGRIFFGGQLMRLYFLIKHRCFFNEQHGLFEEFVLLLGDLRLSFRLIISGVIRLDINRTWIGFIETFNSITARIVMPWLLVISRSKRNWVSLNSRYNEDSLR